MRATLALQDPAAPAHYQDTTPDTHFQPTTQRGQNRAWLYLPRALHRHGSYTSRTTCRPTDKIWSRPSPREVPGAGVVLVTLVPCFWWDTVYWEFGAVFNFYLFIYFSSYIGINISCFMFIPSQRNSEYKTLLHCSGFALLVYFRKKIWKKLNLFWFSFFMKQESNTILNCLRGKNAVKE